MRRDIFSSSQEMIISLHRTESPPRNPSVRSGTGAGTLTEAAKLRRIPAMVVAEVSEKVRGRTVAVGLSNSPMAKDGDARNVQSQLCLWRSGRLRWGVAKRQRRGPQFQPLGRGHQAADELARMLEDTSWSVEDQELHPLGSRGQHFFRQSDPFKRCQNIV